MSDDLENTLKMIHLQVDREADTMCTEAGMLTLGELKAYLLNQDQDAQVMFANGKHPGYFHSYRGHYRYIAITEEDEGDLTVAGLIDTVEEAIGKTYTGWKGGDFKMTKDTPVWVAEEGTTSPGTGITGVHDLEPGTVWLRTGEVED